MGSALRPPPSYHRINHKEDATGVTAQRIQHSIGDKESGCPPVKISFASFYASALLELLLVSWFERHVVPFALPVQGQRGINE